MKRIECSVVKDILPLYLDDVVSVETRDIVKEHLAECPDCRAKAWAMKEELRLPILAEQQKQEARALRQRRWKNIPWKRVVPVLVLAVLTVLCLMALPGRGERLFYQFQAEERYYFFGNTIVYRGPNCPHDPGGCRLHYAEDFSREEQDRIFAALDQLTYMGVTKPKGFSLSEEELYEVWLIFRGDRYDIGLMENGRNHYLYVTSEDTYIEVGNYEPLLQVLEEIFRENVQKET
jgi:hypothetical protein